MDSEDPHYDSGDRKPKNANYGICAFWCLMILFVVIGGLVFAIVYLLEIEGYQKPEAVGLPPTGSPPDLGDICNTPECISLASSLMSNMNNNYGPPCVSFYSFACGNWLDNKDQILEEGRGSVKEYFADDLKDKLRYLIENFWAAALHDTEAVKKAGMVYRACVDKEKREENGLSGILSNSENVLGGWPVLESNPGGNFDSDSFDLTTLLANLFIKFASSSLIHAEAVPDPDYQTRFKMMIKSGKITALPSESYLLDDDMYQKHLDAYVKYMTDVAITFGAADIIGTKYEMQAVCALEKKLAKAKSESTPSKVEMTVRELKEMYPEIDWENFLAAILPEAVEVNDDFVVINYDSQYLRAALDILNEEPSRLISDWLLWLCFEATTLYLNDQVRNIYYDFSEAVTGEKPTSYQTDCSEFVNMKVPNAMGRLFMEWFLDEDTKTMVGEMVANIIASLKEMLVKTEQFGELEVQDALQKINSMKLYIGYPDFILNNDELDKIHAELEVPEDNALAAITKVRVWGIKQNMKLLTDEEFSDEYQKWSRDVISQANVQYNPRDNSLTVHAGLLQPPYFNTHFPWFINYANLGREVVKEALKPVMSSVDHMEFADCVKTQIDGFAYNGVQVDVDLTNPEDVLDVVALQVITKVFMDMYSDEDMNMMKMTLPGLNMTVQQLFFLSTVQTQCDFYKDRFLYEDWADFSQTTTVSPGEFRVTAALYNSEYFSETFNCPAGYRDVSISRHDKCYFG